jgi:hypothetical protein
MKRNDYSMENLTAGLRRFYETPVTTKKAPSKKTFYCAMAEFYTNGTVKTAISTHEYREKPRNREGSNPIMRFSNIWFESMAEAEAFLPARRTA